MKDAYWVCPKCGSDDTLLREDKFHCRECDVDYIKVGGKRSPRLQDGEHPQSLGRGTWACWSDEKPD